MACDGAGAQQQPDLDEPLSDFGHDGGAAALAVVRDQLEVRLRKIVGVSIDGQWDGHGRISSLVNAAMRIVYPKCRGDLSRCPHRQRCGSSAFFCDCPRVCTGKPKLPVRRFGLSPKLSI